MGALVGASVTRGVGDVGGGGGVGGLGVGALALLPGPFTGVAFLLGMGVGFAVPRGGSWTCEF